MSFRNPFAALAVDADEVPSSPTVSFQRPATPVATPAIRRMPYGWRPPVAAPVATPVVVASDFPAIGRQARLAPPPVIGAWGKGIDAVRKAAPLPQPVNKTPLPVAAPVAASSRRVVFSDDEDEDDDEENACDEW